MRIAAALLVVSTGLTLSAQDVQPRPARDVFEVASIKLNKSGEPIAGLRRIPGGRFEATNIQLDALISFAHQLQPFELLGAPPWLTTDRWDIFAKIDGDPPPATPGSQTPDAMMLATRALLADRFKLSMHRETRDLETYRLVLARQDRRPGPGLRQSTYDCAGFVRAQDEAAKGEPPAPTPNTPDHMVCGMRVSVNRIQFGGRPLATLLNVLTPMTQRRIVDETGLTGNWEFDISFNPPAPPRGIDVPPASLDAPSLFTVLQEQLGLKLESTRLPMSVLVVDRVERPAED
jgi:uncharacterized protein (TIGR03435 family)